MILQKSETCLQDEWRLVDKGIFIFIKLFADEHF